MDNKLKQLRLEHGYTIRSLAEALTESGLNITSMTISRYERGEREPKLATWQKLADFFNVSVPYIQGYESPIDFYTSDMKDVSRQRLIRTRLSKEETQNELALILNISAQEVQNFETGDTEPSTEIWNRIAEHYDVSVVWLRGLDRLNKFLTDFNKQNQKNIESNHNRLTEELEKIKNDQSSSDDSDQKIETLLRFDKVLEKYKDNKEISLNFSALTLGLYILANKSNTKVDFLDTLNDSFQRLIRSILDHE